MCARIMWEMNITLSVDAHLLKRARKKAQDVGKSLNQLIREHLERLTATDDASRDIGELRRLTAQGKGRSRGWKFNRDEIHERS